MLQIKAKDWSVQLKSSLFILQVDTSNAFGLQHNNGPMMLAINIAICLVVWKVKLYNLLKEMNLQRNNSGHYRRLLTNIHSMTGAYLQLRMQNALFPVWFAVQIKEMHVCHWKVMPGEQTCTDWLTFHWSNQISQWTRFAAKRNGNPIRRIETEIIKYTDTASSPPPPINNCCGNCTQFHVRFGVFWGKFAWWLLAWSMVIIIVAMFERSTFAMVISDGGSVCERGNGPKPLQWKQLYWMCLCKMAKTATEGDHYAITTPTISSFDRKFSNII